MNKFEALGNTATIVLSGGALVILNIDPYLSGTVRVNIEKFNQQTGQIILSPKGNKSFGSLRNFRFPDKDDISYQGYQQAEGDTIQSIQSALEKCGIDNVKATVDVTLLLGNSPTNMRDIGCIAKVE